MDEISSVRAQNGEEAIASICSGDTKQSVFCALGQECVDDVEAFVEICAKARQSAKNEFAATRGLIRAVCEITGAPKNTPHSRLERELRLRFDALKRPEEAIQKAQDPRRLIQAACEVVDLPANTSLDLLASELLTRFDVWKRNPPTLRAAIAEDLKKAGWSDLTADGAAYLVDAPHVRLRLSRTPIEGSPFSVEIVDKSRPAVQRYTPRTAVAAFVEGWRQGLHDATS